MRWLVLALSVGFSSFALSGHHQRVAGDALEVGEVYILQTDRVPLRPPRELSRARGDVLLPAYTPIDVERRVEHLDRPWYWVRWIRPRTRDRSGDYTGWIDSADLMADGVVVSY